MEHHHVVTEPAQYTADISRELVRLYSARAGRGPTKARTTTDQNTILVVLQEVLTKAELTLAEAGQMESVRESRMALALALRREAVAVIERMLLRKVTTYVPGIDVAADVATVVFLLEPPERDAPPDAE